MGLDSVCVCVGGWGGGAASIQLHVPMQPLCSSTVDIPSVSACCSMGLPVPAFRDTVDSDMVWCVVMDLTSVCVCVAASTCHKGGPSAILLTMTCCTSPLCLGTNAPPLCVCLCVSVAASTHHKSRSSAILLTMTCCTYVCVCQCCSIYPSQEHVFSDTVDNDMLW